MSRPSDESSFVRHEKITNSHLGILDDLYILDGFECRILKVKQFFVEILTLSIAPGGSVASEVNKLIKYWLKKLNGHLYSSDCINMFSNKGMRLRPCISYTMVDPFVDDKADSCVCIAPHSSRIRVAARPEVTHTSRRHDSGLMAHLPSAVLYFFFM